MVNLFKMTESEYIRMDPFGLYFFALASCITVVMTCLTGNLPNSVGIALVLTFIAYYCFFKFILIPNNPPKPDESVNDPPNINRLDMNV